MINRALVELPAVFFTNRAARVGKRYADKPAAGGGLENSLKGSPKTSPQE